MIKNNPNLQMKPNKLLYLVFTLLFFCIPTLAQTTVDYTAIPDTNFEQCLIDLVYDSGTPDRKVLTANIVNGKILDVSGKIISDLTGIQDFVSLTKLSCYFNPLKTLDTNQNTALMEFRCQKNELANLDLSQNLELSRFSCDKNKLTTLDLSKNRVLLSLDCSLNELTALNIKNGNNSKNRIYQCCKKPEPQLYSG